MSAKRVLGRSGIEVSAMGLGCWAIGGPFTMDDKPVGWGEVDDQESIRAIHCGLERGITFIDTADVYGAGHSERVVGEALKGRRNSVVIATKFGLTFDETAKAITGSNASTDYIQQACESSLRRLGIDVIDLYQFHLNDHDMKEAETVRDALESLVDQGKIRFYGWSTDFPERAELFAQGPHCTSVQFQLNVLDAAMDSVKMAEKHNLAGINKGPLAMGLLSGKYTENSSMGSQDVRGNESPSWMEFFKDGKPNPVWLKKLESIREILTSNGRSLAQGALAWIWATSPNTLPIPGFRTVAQVEQNSAAMEFGPLLPEQMKTIDQILNR